MGLILRVKKENKKKSLKIVSGRMSGGEVPGVELYPWQW